MHVRPILAILACALLVAGCSGADPRPDPAPTSPAPTSPAPAATPPASGDGPRYVALGDSYTSGPSIPTQIPSSLLCLRSDHNYAHLLAERLDAASFVDVSCAGATTESVLREQVPAVDDDTELVTMGVGGNDAGLFATMLSTCSRVAEDDATGTPCRTAIGAVSERRLELIGSNVESTLRDLRDSAPDAVVVLVGYPRILPDTGTCRAVPFAAGDYAWARGIEERLDVVLGRAAGATGTVFVSMRDASRGHDACAGSDAWVNGAVGDPARALAFHPFAEGMAGVADRVAERLSTS